MHVFKVVSPESGDWEGLYMDGKLIAEGHRVRVEDVLHAISDVFPNTFDYFEIDDDKAEFGLPQDLIDIEDYLI